MFTKFAFILKHHTMPHLIGKDPDRKVKRHEYDKTANLNK